jgi:ubiquinol-cytochrome c reductase cytochrome b subunit
MLGEIALYSFIILLLTGTYLSFFYTPSLTEVVYDGSYVPLKGVTMSQAYASTLDISFDVRGGLIMRQIHHWSALLFMASIACTSCACSSPARSASRASSTGSSASACWCSASPRASPATPAGRPAVGTGARIANGIALSIPVVGTWTAFLVFGGEYPGTALLDRLYIAHVFILPLILLGLITFHLMMIWYQKHTQFAGPGRTEDNVVGSRLYPAYAAKAGGFFFLVFAVLAALGGLAQINPIWLYGPYNPSQVSAGSQPTGTSASSTARPG